MALVKPKAVITGAGSGLGRAFCVEVGRRGGRVIASDVNEEGANETARLVAEAGGEAHVFRCDVRDAEQVEALAKEADRLFGATDLLVNNAGVAVGGPIGQVPLADWRWIVDINLWGVVHGCHAFVPRMKKDKRGHVINVASAAGLLSPPELGPYNVTKAAVVALSETLHGECEHLGVHVTVLCPTFFKTNIMEAARGPKNARQEAMAKKRMETSKLQASDVARIAIEHVERGDLYCVPMADGRTMWRIKRAAPERYAGIVAAVPKSPRLRKMLGVD